MILTILHPGEMGASVAAAAISSGHRVLWVSEGRSEATKQRALFLELEDVRALSAINESDIVFSICPPNAAIQMAKDVAETKFKGLYVDANAGSPEKKLLINELLKSHVQFNKVTSLLIKKNKEQLFILEKYIKVQKKVLDKHEKSRNYDAFKIVKYSILKMNEFKEEFEQWFQIKVL